MEYFIAYRDLVELGFLDGVGKRNNFLSQLFFLMKLII